MKLAKAMATVAGLTGLSRVAGFTRDILTAAILGAGPIADAFFVALKLPNFFRRVTAEGAFSVAFVPLYSETLEKDGRDEADIFASNAFMVMLLTLSVFTFVAMAFMPFLINVIAPGFGDDPLRYDTAVELSRITFPYLMLMSLAALMGGVLNAHDRFAPFASAPILFNLTLIAALLFAVPAMDTPGHAMAWGVFAAGIVQLVWLILSICRAGVKLRLQKPKMDGDIKKLFKLMGPGVIGAGVMHINLFADMIIASLLPAGSISYLYYADRLNQLPLGIVGIAVGTALLPMLSKSLAANEKGETQKLFNRALEICFLLAIPAACAYIAIYSDLVRVLFERGAFEAKDTFWTGLVLMAYAIGIPAYVAVKVFSTVYWSHEDTLTPVKISIFATILNIIASLILIRYIGVVGIALATGCAGWVQFALMKRGLKKFGGFEFDQRLKLALAKIVGVALMMAGVIAGISQQLYDRSAEEYLLGAWPSLIVLVLSGLVFYGAAILLTGTISRAELKKYLTRKAK